ncbi:unnamed protein product [Acanthoscelides obtectus]|uniref:Uncharacterized protein n=1 Tax=Acanthoscelides obtectus TaxID=200917 RepID=A0A9P0QFZ2_ACAOB|nr:unnamed protein product [Acanthoscelides obtectus]CAK1685810.1 hypothetical protein AOBTE_LOCUS35633 [Acanthoscelides obtectus]
MLTQKTSEAESNYSLQKKKMKQILREKKYHENNLQHIGDNYKNKQIRNLYQGVNNEKRGYQTRTTYYKDKNGKKIFDEEEALARWKQYFEQLLNPADDAANDYNEKNSTIHQRPQLTEEDPQTLSVVENLISILKNGKIQKCLICF